MSQLIDTTPPPDSGEFRAVRPSMRSAESSPQAGALNGGGRSDTDHPDVSAAQLTSGFADLLGPRLPAVNDGGDGALSPLTSRSLIASAQRGDKAALGALLRQLQDPWYRLSLAMLRDAELACEAVQETGLRFLRQLSGFRGDSQLRTWSLGIAINVVRELKRRRGRLTCVGDPASDLVDPPGDDAPHASAGMERQEAKDHVRKLLGELPDRQREAVVLRFFEDLSVDETAKLMGCAAGTVKATVHQALRSLRKRLGSWM